MTISTTANSSIFLGNGVTLVFSFAFVCDSSSDLQAIYTDADGIQTPLTPSQYTIFLNPIATGSLHRQGGTITYPLTGVPIANGTSLTLTRVVPLNQTTSISNQGDFYPTVVEQALDDLCLEIQQVSGKTGQLRGTWQTGIDYSYGDVVQDGANGANTLNYYMCTIANTSDTWEDDLSAGDWSLAIDVQAISGYATSAAASAATATTQAGIATAQASAASISASNAATSASSSSTSAATSTTQAAISTAAASSALSSQTAAASSASSASTSAGTATTQASISTTQASIATTQAGIATTQASAASASAAAAAASAVLAGSTLTATSTTSNTIGTGNFTFTTQADKNFFPGQPIQAASAANGANYINGFVFSYSGTTLVITETNNGGSGAHSDWNISVSGTQGASGIGSGTVTSVSVTTAGGVSGSVATATSTPAITITLGAITPSSVAAVGAVTGSNLSGTNTGDQTSVSGNAGTATALATARAIYGNNFDGTAALTQVIASTYGGTGNGFTKISGPATSEKTFTLPNSSAAILTDAAAVTVAQGGTGLGTLTANNVILGNGTSTPGFVAPGTSGNVLTSNGTTWASSTPPSTAGSVVYNAQSGPYAIVASDNGKLVDFTGSGSPAFTLTAAATLGNGWFCYIRNNSAQANSALVLSAQVAELIDGINNFYMYPDEIRLVQCTGTTFNSLVLHGFNYRALTSVTFILPPGYKSLKGYLWGSGASGGKGATNGGGGGGGGACLPFDILASTIGTAGTGVSVTIGAGGASQTTANTAGNDGNSSTFGSFFTAYRGGGGGGGSAGGGGGGGGSGYLNPNTPGAYVAGDGAGTPTTNGGSGGVSWDARTGAAAGVTGAIYGGGGGGGTADIVGGGYYGGGGGGKGKTGTGSAGGYSVYGGAGGGSAGASAGGTGGASIYGGSGGSGATGSSNATAGSAPGGGGGGCVTGNSGAGGAGGIEIQGYV